MKCFKTISVTILGVFFLQACSGDNSGGVTQISTPQVDTQVITTIVDAAVSDGNFTTLVAALQATGLDTTLADTNSTFTVFAPTDKAFSLQGQETISTVDAYAANGQMLTTASEAGVGVGIDAATGMLMIGGANVVISDIHTTNGVIHVIDTVILE
jgi:transforming growth factor-beta-induced protein